MNRLYITANCGSGKLSWSLDLLIATLHLMILAMNGFVPKTMCLCIWTQNVFKWVPPIYARGPFHLATVLLGCNWACRDDVIKWKHFPRHWPFVRRIQRSPVNPPHKGQWRGALVLSLFCAWTNGLANNRDLGWFKTPSRPLWRHSNARDKCICIAGHRWWIFPVWTFSWKPGNDTYDE